MYICVYMMGNVCMYTWETYVCMYVMGNVCVYVHDGEYMCVSQGGMYVCMYVYVIKGNGNTLLEVAEIKWDAWEGMRPLKVGSADPQWCLPLFLSYLSLLLIPNYRGW